MRNLLVIFIFVIIGQSSLGLFEDWSEPSKSYITDKKDTWETVAKKFNTPLQILKRFNKHKLQKNLKANQKVFIPAKILYKIKVGESAIKIAISHGMTFSELVMLNNLSDPDSLRPGDSLKIFDASVKFTKSNKAEHKKQSSNNIKLVWPVKGKVNTKFGLQTNGSRNDNIHILIDEPQIKTAAPGIVVYIGNEVGNYGNLIIIQHEQNWFSSYGNLSAFNVKKGDNVVENQIIGTININDSEQKPELYFGLRLGALAVNPIKYLKKSKA